MRMSTGMRPLARHKAFWRREETDRPLLGFNLGGSAHEHCPSTAQHIPVGPVSPDDRSLASVNRD